MNNTDKLLRAFIEASGYEVEEIFEQKIPSGQIIVPHDYKVTKKENIDISSSFDFGQLSPEINHTTSTYGNK